MPTEQVGAEFAALKLAARDIADWPHDLALIKAITGASLACNLGPHVTDVGITDGATGQVFADSILA